MQASDATSRFICSLARCRVVVFFQGLLEHPAVERQLGDEELEAADLGLEFGHAKLFTRYGILLEGLPAVVSGRSDAGLAARLVDVQAGVEVGLDVAEDRGDAVRSRSFSHGSLPGSLPVVRLPLRLDQVLGGRPGPEDPAVFRRCLPPGLGRGPALFLLVAGRAEV